MPKFDTIVTLSEPTPNAFEVLGRATKSLRTAGATEQELKEYRAEAIDGNYDNLMAVTRSWVTIKY